MAGTVTVVEEAKQAPMRSVARVQWDWESDGSGDADGTTEQKFDGQILTLFTNPDGGGDQPSDDYDVSIVDENGADVLHGAGADRDDTVNEYADEAALGAVSYSTLTLAITNAGAANKGTVVLWIR